MLSENRAGLERNTVINDSDLTDEIISWADHWKTVLQGRKRHSNCHAITQKCWQVSRWSPWENTFFGVDLCMFFIAHVYSLGLIAAELPGSCWGTHSLMLVRFICGQMRKADIWNTAKKAKCALTSHNRHLDFDGLGSLESSHASMRRPFCASCQNRNRYPEKHETTLWLLDLSAILSSYFFSEMISGERRKHKHRSRSRSPSAEKTRRKRSRSRSPRRKRRSRSRSRSPVRRDYGKSKAVSKADKRTLER